MYAWVQQWVLYYKFVRSTFIVLGTVGSGVNDSPTPPAGHMQYKKTEPDALENIILIPSVCYNWYCSTLHTHFAPSLLHTIIGGGEHRWLFINRRRHLISCSLKSSYPADPGLLINSPWNYSNAWSSSRSTTYTCACLLQLCSIFFILYSPLCIVFFALCNVLSLMMLCCFPHFTVGHFPFEVSRSTTVQCSSHRVHSVALYQHLSVTPVQLDSTWKTPGSSLHETTSLNSASALLWVQNLFIWCRTIIQKVSNSFLNLFCIDYFSRAPSICRVVVVVRDKAVNTTHYFLNIFSWTDDKKGTVLTSL